MHSIREHCAARTRMRIPSRLLSAEDELFKAIAYRQELNTQAYRQSTTEGLAGTARDVPSFPAPGVDRARDPHPDHDPLAQLLLEMVNP